MAAGAVVALAACGGEAPDGGAPGGDRRPDGVGGVPAPAMVAGDSSGPAGRPLTGDERAGERIFRRENCSRCHTLFDAPPPSGPVDLPGAATPSALDSRVGPDLGLTGHRRSDDWHYAHLYAPGVVVPGSRMTPSRHLFRAGAGGRPEPTGDARRLVAWMQTLGRSRRDVWAEWRRAEHDIPAPARRPAAERQAEGERSYARHCAACHGVSGDGRGPAAPLLDRPPRDFTTAAYRFRSTTPGEPPTDADLFRSITLGTGTGAAMPAFAHLPAEERWSLVLRIKEFSPVLRGRGIGTEEPLAGRPRTGAAGTAGSSAADGAGTPAPREADLVATGAVLYAELGCASCHGSDAAGRTAPGEGDPWRDEAGLPIPGTGDLRHACGLRAGASEEALSRALLHGVGPVMPSFALALEGRPWAPRALRAWLLSLDPESAATAPAAPAVIAPGAGPTGP